MWVMAFCENILSITDLISLSELIKSMLDEKLLVKAITHIVLLHPMAHFTKVPLCLS